MKIQQELDETKIVLHKTVESMLQRGEKVDDLVKQSEGLSARSRAFYTRVCPGSGSLGNEFWQIVKGEEAELVLRSYVGCAVQVACDALIGRTEYFGRSFGSGRLVGNLYRYPGATYNKLISVHVHIFEISGQESMRA